MKETVPMLLFCLGLVLAVPGAEETPPKALDLGDGVKLELVRIVGGKFQQGSPENEKGRRAGDEKQHAVRLNQDYLLGKFPVTRRQFERFVSDSKYQTEAETGGSGGFGLVDGKLVQRKEFTWRKPGFAQTDDHPVVLVTCDDARAFCAWLSKKTKRTIDLPTEAQWEYACRAGTMTRFPNGDKDEDLRDIAWFKDNSGDGTRSVGLKKANAWGLFDMCGNVNEWCRDWYAPYSTETAVDPVVPDKPKNDTPRRVLRGGSFSREARHCRSAARYRNTPGSRNADNGFRIMVTDEKDKSGQGETASTYRAGFVPPAALLALFEDWLGPLLLIAFVVFFLAVLFRPSRPKRLEDRPPPRPLSQITPRIVDDGFWIDDPWNWIPQGHRLRYRCQVADQPKTGTSTYDFGRSGLFVYTGGRPQDVVIEEVLPPLSAAASQVVNDSTNLGPGRATFEEVDRQEYLRRTDSSPTSTPLASSSSNEPFAGYPSAY